MSKDDFALKRVGLESPGVEHFAITPNDSNDLPSLPRAIYVGSGGDLVLTDKNGVDCTYKPTDNSYVLMRAVRVKSTGTTATNIIGIM